MAELLDGYLLEGAEGALRLEACRPCYARYKPGHSLIVKYEVALRDVETGSMLQTFASAALYAGEHANDLWSERSCQRLVASAARSRRYLQARRVAYVPPLRGIVQLYPLDLELPQLAHAASSTKMRRTLRKVLPVGSGTANASSRPELIQYRPCLKALLRYPLSDGQLGAAYAKVKNSKRSARIFDLNRALFAAGVPTPAPLTYVSDLGMALYAEAKGVSLAALNHTPEYVRWMEPVAEALAYFHSTQLSDPQLYSLRTEAEAVVAAGRVVATLLPHLSAEIDRMSMGIAADLSAITEPIVMVHGDFYDDQVLASEAGVMLLDFEETRLGNPLLDLGNFLAHLSIFPSRLAEVAEDARARFVDAYAARYPNGLEHSPSSRPPPSSP
jgi:hypothetical protein